MRISVTDQCNLRCRYCMPLDPVWLPKAEILSFDEIERLARIAVAWGVRKIRLTGGEPLLRDGLPDLVQSLAKIQGLQDLGMTTNGFYLHALAHKLARAGLNSLNVSLDTLDPGGFQRMARRGALEKVLQGLRAATQAGFVSIKINAVVIRGQNEDQIPALCRFGRENGFPVRFIEFMPLDGDRAWNRKQLVPMKEILEKIAEVGPLVPDPHPDPSSPALRWRFADGVGEVGVIASVTKPFCASCDRVRITADGKFRTCLFSREETDLRTPLRKGFSDEAIGRLLFGAVRAKPAGHGINSPGFIQPARPMNAIGG